MIIITQCLLVYADNTHNFIMYILLHVLCNWRYPGKGGVHYTHILMQIMQIIHMYYYMYFVIGGILEKGCTLYTYIALFKSLFSIGFKRNTIYFTSVSLHVPDFQA